MRHIIQRFFGMFSVSPAFSGRRGFTMVEILVVTAITSLLASILLLYGRVGEDQLILYKEQTKLVSTIYRAKALAVETYSEPEIPCGYGIHFVAPRSYLIFRDNAANCAASDNRYVAGGGDVVIQSEVFHPQVSFQTLPVSDILFVPPDPRVRFTPSGVSGEVTIIVATPGGTSLPVTINSQGQITI